MENESQTEITNLKYLLQSDRVSQEFEDPKKIEYILKEYMKFDQLVLKNFENHPEIFFQKKLPDGTFQFRIPEGIHFPEKTFTIYRTLSKHIEITFTIENLTTTTITGRPLKAKIAKFPRKYPRIPVKEDLAYAHNFVVTPPTIDISKITGVSGQMLLRNEFNMAFPDSAANLFFFDKAEISPEVGVIKLHKIPIAIADTKTMTNAIMEGMKFFNIRSFYEEEHMLGDKMEHLQKSNTKCFAYYPVFFKNGKYMLPVAYFYYEGHGNTEIQDILQKFKTIETNFNEKILQSNKQKIDIEQKIINISEGGFLLEVTDDSLLDSIKVKDEFTVDLVFKKQAPLRFFSRVKYIAEGNSYHVGAEIIGSSDTKKNMDYLRSFIKLIQEP